MTVESTDNQPPREDHMEVPTQQQQQQAEEDLPKRSRVHVDHDKVAFVFWEATVTGRRLIDEMINLGAYFVSSEGQDSEFNEYVMPYGKLPMNVTRNYNLRIVDTGRYRMLKEVRTNKMLKSKSEVAACIDFAAWLTKMHKEHCPDKKIVLVSFEPRHSKVLQLFQNLERFRLLDEVGKIVLGSVNGWDLLRPQISELKDEHRQVLKLLVESHLSAPTDGSVPLETACQRAKAVHRLLSKVQGTSGRTALDSSRLGLEDHIDDAAYLLDEVKDIKEELMKEAQWRPVFADMFRQGIKPRRRAGFLRHLLVESGLSYADVAEAFKDGEVLTELVKEKMKSVKSANSETDVDELIKVLKTHLTAPEKPVRRGSGRRGPRTRSLCAPGDLLDKTDKSLKDLTLKDAEETNNNVAVEPVEV